MVEPWMIRVVTGGRDKKGCIEYEDLGNEGKVKTASETEVSQMLKSSEHFKKAIEYVEHRDNKALSTLRQSDSNTIYMAIMKCKNETLLLTDPDDPGAEDCLEYDCSDQAYVGMASGGVYHRWGHAGNHHIKCSNHLQLRQEIELVKEGVVTRSRGSKNTMLVDATMRLHCSQGGIVWIFIIAQIDGPPGAGGPLAQEEHRLMEYFKSYGERGMNAKS